MKENSCSANRCGLTAHRKQSATQPCRLPALIGMLLCVAELLAPGNVFPQAVKPDPAGIIDLPGAISANAPIGTLDDHPWLNPNVDGLRIRASWSDIETADNVYNWPLIDDCLANALTSVKFIGLGVIAGIDTLPWL